MTGVVTTARRGRESGAGASEANRRTQLAFELRAIYNNNQRHKGNAL